MKNTALAPIEVEILLFFSLKNKRLKRIAGIAPNIYLIPNFKKASTSISWTDVLLYLL